MSNQNIQGKKLIVSLTSFPKRINTVHHTVESVLNQSLKADKIILWLAQEEFPNKEKDLPEELLKLKNFGLTIDWCKNLKSYKKLIPAVQNYPDDIIVTIDDDIIYKDDMLQKLYSAYLKNGRYIYAHRITRLYKNDKQWKILSRELYLDKKRNCYKSEIRFQNAYNKLTGVGGYYIPRIVLKTMFLMKPNL